MWRFPLLTFCASLLMNGGQTGSNVASPAWQLCHTLPHGVGRDKLGLTHDSKGVMGRARFSWCPMASCWLEVTWWTTHGCTSLVPSRGHFISRTNMWGHLFAVLFFITSHQGWNGCGWNTASLTLMLVVPVPVRQLLCGIYKYTFISREVQVLSSLAMIQSCVLTLLDSWALHSCWFTSPTPRTEEKRKSKQKKTHGLIIL